MYTFKFFILKPNKVFSQIAKTFDIRWQMRILHTLTLLLAFSQSSFQGWSTYRIQAFLEPCHMLLMVSYMISPVSTHKELTDWGVGMQKQKGENRHIWEARWKPWDFEAFCSLPKESQLITAEQNGKQGLSSAEPQLHPVPVSLPKYLVILPSPLLGKQPVPHEPAPGKLAFPVSWEPVTCLELIPLHPSTPWFQPGTKRQCGFTKVISAEVKLPLPHSPSATLLVTYPPMPSCQFYQITLEDTQLSQLQINNKWAYSVWDMVILKNYSLFICSWNLPGILCFMW